MRRRGLLLGLAGSSLLGACVTKASPATAAAELAFPGALGWAAGTPGGRGGRVLRVTTLAASGPGSLKEAIEADGPRIVVFEVGGVIDLERTTLNVRKPFITIAGQTAPSPGVTLIRGGMNIRTHDVIVQHIRVRPGEAGQAKKSGWEVDGICTLAGAHDVIVDHCSCTWATDENLSASGPRHEGAGPEQWRQATSHRITFSNNIIAEGLSNSTHSKGEHSKGSLIHDNVTEALVIGNLYAHNRERNVLFKGGAHGAMVNNLVYNPGRRTAHYNLHPHEWGEHAHQPGRLSQVGNVMRAGPSTPENVALFMVGGAGELQLHQADNIALDRAG
ncbi:MAG TPA: pectate lyase, partial [Caulobacteraceae bacterium]